MIMRNLKSSTTEETKIFLAEEEAELRTSRKNFPDRVKAEVFAHDRATCGLSGVNLWLLEEGACGFYAWSHIDHIQPATRGGDDSASNGVTTHWVYNKMKRDNVPAIYQFIAGAPTIDFFSIHRQLSSEMAQRLAQYSEMHPSDWYFNSALSNLLHGVCWLHEWKEWGYSRDDEYYARSAVRRIQEWKSIVAKEKVPSFEERGLVMEPPLADQLLLLSLREKSSVAEVRDLMTQVLPYHAANTALVNAFQAEYARYLNGEDIDFTPVWEFYDHPYISDDTFGRMIINMKLITDPYAELKELPDLEYEDSE